MSRSKQRVIDEANYNYDRGYTAGLFDGAYAERARIKAAVQSLRKNYYGEELDLAKVKGYLLAIIDGEQA